jgi:hypothetical protein
VYFLLARRVWKQTLPTNLPDARSAMSVEAVGRVVCVFRQHFWWPAACRERSTTTKAVLHHGNLFGTYGFCVFNAFRNFLEGSHNCRGGCLWVPTCRREGRRERCREGSKFVCTVNREGLLPDPPSNQKYHTKILIFLSLSCREGHVRD